MNRKTRRRRGFTVVEIMIAMSLSIIVLGASGVVLLSAAREERQGLAAAGVGASAGHVQDRLTRLLRLFSARESVIFSNPVTHNGAVIGYRSLIVARGEAPDYPREEISFHADTGQLIHDSNLSDPNTAVAVLHSDEPGIQLTDVYFYPALSPDGTEDRRQLNVVMTFSDEGYGGTRKSGQIVQKTVRRTFTVTMRNF